MRGGENGQDLYCELEGRFLYGTWVAWLEPSTKLYLGGQLGPACGQSAWRMILNCRAPCAHRASREG